MLRRVPVIYLLAVTLSLPLAAHAQTPIQFLDDSVSGEVDIRAELPVTSALSPQASLRIVFCYLDDNNYLYLHADATGVRLGKVRKGADTRLAALAAFPQPRDGAYQLTIKRRAWSIRVVSNGVCILTAHDAFAPGEKIGYVAQGVKIGDVYAQPIGEMMLHDDFARPPGEPSPWRTVEGKWVTSLPDTRNDRAEAAKSANPFSYRATGKSALAVAGERFWEGYAASVAVKPASGGAVGLAAYASDEKNYYLFRVPAVKSADDAQKAELIRYLDGRPTTLAQAPASVLAGKWYKLTIRAHDGYLDGLLDGRVVVAAYDDTFAEGPMGLYMEGCSKAFFDDVKLEPYEYYTDTYEPDEELLVEQLAGKWTLHNGWLIGAPDPTTYTAIGLTGSPEWDLVHCYARG